MLVKRFQIARFSTDFITKCTVFFLDNRNLSWYNTEDEFFKSFP